MKHVHFMGIGGSGASAVASIANAQGYKVSGCDKSPYNEFTKDLPQDHLFQGHSSEHLKDVDILAITPAITALDPDNEELKAAKEKGIEVLTWQQFMGKYLEEEKFVIAICGTHGKSSTTAMVSTVLEEAGLDPTAELGATLPKWGKNHRIGLSKYFVTEADEFNDNFLASTPDITVVTTIEMDHPEYFKDFESYKESFFKFLCSTKGSIVANMSDPGVADVLKRVMKETMVQVLDYSKSDFGFKASVPGQHMQMNANAAFQVGLLLGIEPEQLKKSLSGFTGIGRRFELLGNIKGSPIYSDFGHHPTEIRVNLQAIRDHYPDKKIITIFQPHMFSRTKALFADFKKVLHDAPVDLIYVLDIYPSREVDTGLVSSLELVEAINKESVTYKSNPEQLLQDLAQKADEDTVFFFIGAGDTHKWAQDLLNYV